MPPWHADSSVGRFLNERRLTDAERDTIVEWVDAGAPEGDRAKLPPLPTFADGWQIGTPDVIIEMVPNLMLIMPTRRPATMPPAKVTRSVSLTSRSISPISSASSSIRPRSPTTVTTSPFSSTVSSRAGSSTWLRRIWVTKQLY